MVTLNLPLYQPDLKRNPSFPEGLLVILTRDYRGASYHFTTRFDEDEVCRVAKCSLSWYAYDKRYPKHRFPFGGVEWRSVEICGMDDEPDECCVKAEQLIELTDEEFENLLRLAGSELTGN